MSQFQILSCSASSTNNMLLIRQNCVVLMENWKDCWSVVKATPNRFRPWFDSMHCNVGSHIVPGQMPMGQRQMSWFINFIRQYLVSAHSLWNFVRNMEAASIGEGCLVLLLPDQLTHGERKEAAVLLFSLWVRMMRVCGGKHFHQCRKQVRTYETGSAFFQAKLERN